MSISTAAVLCALCCSVVWSQAPPKDPDFKPPKLLRSVTPEYPKEAMEAGLTGSVVLLIDIEVDGSVSDVVVEKVSGATGVGFEEAALGAAKKLRFRPAMEAGIPVPVQITFRFRFKLDPDFSPPPPPSPEAPVEPDPPPEERPAPVPEVNFSGVLLERGTRVPLTGVLVTVFQGQGEEADGYEVLTDSEGRFEFRGLMPGAWRVFVHPEGFYPLRTEEAVPEKGRLEVVFRLERGSYNHLDVLVEGVRGEAHVTRRTVDEEDIALMPGIYGDPLKVIRALPGVAQTNIITSDIVIRGGAPQDTRFSAFGLEMPVVFHFGGIRGIFPPGSVRSVSLLPGNFPVYYGRSIGGVVDVLPQDRVPDRVGGDVSISLLDSSLTIEVPLGDQFWVAVAAQRSYIDTIVGLTGLIIGEDVVFPRYLDLHLMAGWRPDADHDLRFFALLSDDDFVVYSTQPEPDIDESSLPELTFAALGGRYTWTPDDLTWATSLALERVRIRQSALTLALILSELVEQTEHDTVRLALRSHLEAPMSPHTTARVGVDAFWAAGSLDIKTAPFFFEPFEPVPDLPGDLEDLLDGDISRDIGRLEIAGYAELELTHVENLTVVPGVRVDGYQQTGDLTFDPRLNTRYQFNETLSVSAAVGLFHQPPLDEALDPLLGNPDLGPEEATHVELGTAWDPWPALHLELTGFYKHMRDLVELSPLDLFLLTPGQLYKNDGEGRAFGVEVFARFRPESRLSGWLAYTLSRSERRRDGARKFEEYAFNQTHNLVLFMSYRFPRNWSVGASFRYASGFPLFDDVRLGGLTGRADAFYQFDLRVDKKWIYDTWALTVFFDIQNVTNRFNFSSPGGVPTGSDSVPPPGTPILPIFGFRGEF